MTTKFTFDEAGLVGDGGEQVPGWGLVFQGMFICHPRLSECGRFEISPSYYGLTEAEADELDKLNEPYLRKANDA